MLQHVALQLRILRPGTAGSRCRRPRAVAGPGVRCHGRTTQLLTANPVTEMRVSISQFTFQPLAFHRKPARFALGRRDLHFLIAEIFIKPAIERMLQLANAIDLDRFPACLLYTSDAAANREV